MIGPEKTAKEIIREHGGIIKTSEALEKGIHPRTFYHLRDTGELERLARGLYKLAEVSPYSDPDLVVIAVKISDAVVCLVSALAVHGLTTQIPRFVHIAIPRSVRYPKLEYPPLKVYRFSENSYASGVEKLDIGNVPVPVYNPEKTISDCFKYRNKLGIDIVIEALRNYKKTPGANLQYILEYSRVNRVERQIRPYLDALV